jgi:hypothetical protein
MRGAIVCVLMFVAGCGGVSSKKDDGGKPGETAKGGIPENWTHRELLEHLNKKGLKLRMVPTNLGGAFGVPAHFVNESSGIKDADAADTAFDKNSPDVVYCLLMKTAQEAKDQAGASTKGFASGRFAFSGSGAQFEKIRGALP